MDTRAWLKRELKKSGKTQAGLARHLKRGKDSVSLLLSGQRRLTHDDAVLIAGFIGVQLPGPIEPAVTAVELIGVPVKGVAMEQMWREGVVKPAMNVVAGVIDSTYPLEVQYGLLVDEPDRPPEIASECVLCVPIAKLQRPLRKNDLLHCERTRSVLTQTVLRRVASVNGKACRVSPRGTNGPTEPIADYDVKGIVIGRTERFVV